MTERIYFLGIGGTLMGSLAMLAKEAGQEVSGSDQTLYPPMSDQLAAAGITVFEGFDPAQLNPAPDLVVIGNAALPRGHPGIEYVLEQGIDYVSGAEWLGRYVLRDRWVLAVSGTHGKTTTASLLTWILDQAGLAPGYLIGGVPLDFERSARLGESPFFVVEADEYDTSYFDRRSKFVHYRPRTLIINNLEYDHADIFPDLAAIQTQFHHLLRSVPSTGLILAPEHDDAVDAVLKMGCWTPVARVRNGPGRARILSETDLETGDLWSAVPLDKDGSRFNVMLGDAILGEVHWSQFGTHNISNALNAIAAARHAGVPPEHAITALCSFQGVARRMQLVGEHAGIRVYDDFAHHPTAIRTTLQGLRGNVGGDEIIAVVEPRSHTMSLGTLRDELATCCAAADRAFWFRGENIKWDLHEVVNASVIPATLADDIEHLVGVLADLPPPKKQRHIVIMSNGSFGGMPRLLSDALSNR
jgi:UDP-N-acetylmuramate: L-alanyl-gamma-D-glutamyl-meso-diaminopimelate ligase